MAEAAGVQGRKPLAGFEAIRRGRRKPEGEGTQGRALSDGRIRPSLLTAPAVILLFLWMVVPLGMTLWFSLQRYNLLNPFVTGFAGVENYRFLLTDPILPTVLWNTTVLVGAVLAITIVLGVLLAVLFDQDFFGRGVARLLLIAPFFVMPTVSALIWKNLLMHPVNGALAWVTQSLGIGAVDWFGSWPLASIIIIVAWQWIPFATLILLTAMQSLDRQQIEAARLDGAGALGIFHYVTIPHLARPIGVVVMIEAIFLLQVFAEIHVTTSGGPGQASMNLPYLVYMRALLEWDVGGASAGGILAVVVANVFAVLLIRTLARSLDR